MANLTIGPLISGGLVLGYRCPSQCRHCLYNAGPHRKDGLPGSDEELDQVLNLLASQGARAQYHIGGGEPFLHRDLLKQAIEGMEQRRLALEYVETNGAWVKDKTHAEETLEEFASLGLSCILVSLSPFHAEYIPLEKTLTLIQAANKILSRGAFVWIREFLTALSSQPREEKLDFDSWIKTMGGDRYAVSIGERYSLVPAGRAGRYFAAHGIRKPWEAFRQYFPCDRRLADTTHFHVDGKGRYVPGLCAGLVLPIKEVPGTIDLKKYPLLDLLVNQGPCGLVDLAAPLGFYPEKFYSSACDLCTHVRTFLFHQNGELYKELGPKGFYDSRSFEPYEWKETVGGEP